MALGERIIDMHLHVDLPPEDVPARAPALCRPEPCAGEGEATASQAETLEKTLEVMEHYNIVKAFLSGVNLETVREWTAANELTSIRYGFVLSLYLPSLTSIISSATIPCPSRCTAWPASLFGAS